MILLELIEKLNSTNGCMDIYLGGWDDCGPTYCFDEENKFTDYGKEKYKDVLNREVVDWKARCCSDLFECWLKEPDANTEEAFEKLFDKIKSFLYDTAGYCSNTEYDKIYGLNNYENGPIWDNFDIELKYGISLDCDFLGANYDKIKQAYDNNVSKEEFEKLIDELSE
jgi:hypothetical protein